MRGKQMDTKVIDDQDILYIIMPAYNEEENIQAVVETWYPIVEKYNGGGCSTGINMLRFRLSTIRQE